jgi:hypothetical protein
MENKTLGIGATIKMGWRTFIHHVGFTAGIAAITIVVWALPLVIMHLLGVDIRAWMEVPAKIQLAAAQNAEIALQGGTPAEIRIVEFLPQISPLLATLWISLRILSGLVIGAGLTLVTVKAVSGETLSLKDFFSPLRHVKMLFSFLVASVLYSIIVFTGLMLFVIPALFLIPQFSLWPYFVVKHRMGPIEALKAASVTSKGARMSLLGLYVALVLLVIAVMIITNLLGFFTLAILHTVVGAAGLHAGVTVYSIIQILTIIAAVAVAYLARAGAYKTLVAQTQLPSHQGK